MKRRHPCLGVLAVLVLAGEHSARTAAQQAPTPAAPAGAALVAAQKQLPWAFPLAEPGARREDDGTVKTLVGGARGFTVPEI